MAAPCPTVGEGSCWDSGILGSVGVFFAIHASDNVHSDIVCEGSGPQYFYIFRYQLDTFPRFPLSLLLALAALSTQGFMASWEYPVCSTDQVSGPGKGGCAGVAPFPFEKSRTNTGFKAQ